MGSHSVTCHPAEVTFPPCVVWPTLGSTTSGEQNRTAKYRIDSVCVHSTTVPLLEGSTSPLNPHPQRNIKNPGCATVTTAATVAYAQFTLPDPTKLLSRRVGWCELNRRPSAGIWHIRNNLPTDHSTTFAFRLPVTDLH